MPSLIRLCSLVVAPLLAMSILSSQPASAEESAPSPVSVEVPEHILAARKEHAGELEKQIAELEKTINDVRRGRLREPGKSRRQHLAELRGELAPLETELAAIDRWFPPLDLAECRVGCLGRVASPMKVAKVVDEANVIGHFRTADPTDPTQTLVSPFWLTNVETKGMQEGESVEIDAVFEVRNNDREGQLAVPELRRRVLPDATATK